MQNSNVTIFEFSIIKSNFKIFFEAIIQRGGGGGDIALTKLETHSSETVLEIRHIFSLYVVYYLGHPMLKESCKLCHLVCVLWD